MDQFQLTKAKLIYTFYSKFSTKDKLRKKNPLRFISHQCRNVVYGLTTNILDIGVRQRIVRFYGHVRKHDSLQRIITEGMVNGKRGRGRKRCGWLGNVSRYAGMNIKRCAEIATNREEWRTIVSNVVSDKEQR